MKSVGLGKSEHKVTINLRFANGLSSHLQISNEVLVFASATCNLNDLDVVARIIGTDVGIYGQTGFVQQYQSSP
jgi:hypothetical protein